MSNDTHGRSATPALVFSDPGVAAPSHAERARTLVSLHATGSLGTVAIDPPGYPYASFVTFALVNSEPVFLISRLAEHTRNLLADARASLLVHERDKADPLANGRVTLIGDVTMLPRATSEAVTAREAYLIAHPNAAYFIDFEDFELFRMRLRAVRYIGGYGRMSWVTADDFRRAEVDPLAKSGARILGHMNADHSDALRLYARAFTSARDAEKATMTAVDRHGFDLSVITPRGNGPARIAFERPLTQSDDIRQILIDMKHVAEAKLSAS